MAYRNTVRASVLEDIVHHYIASRSRGSDVIVLVRLGLIILQEDPDHPDKLCAVGPVDAPWPVHTEAPELLALISEVPTIDEHLEKISRFLTTERSDELVVVLTRGQICFTKRRDVPGTIWVSARGIMPTLQEHQSEPPLVEFDDTPESDSTEIPWDGNFDDILSA